MRILLDESAPRALKGLLEGHEVETVLERGWGSKRNGELLALAVAQGFDVFVTPDQSLPDQQTLARFDIAIVVLAVGRNRMETYRPIADRVRATIERAPRSEATWLTA